MTAVHARAEPAAAPAGSGRARAASAPALSIGRSDDPAEREAERAATAIMTGAAVLRPIVRPPALRRACAACEREETVRRAPDGGGGGTGAGGAAPASMAAALAGPGHALTTPVRDGMAARFGRDFGDVRVHTDGAAALAAREVGAHAFTVGSAIAFAEGAYRPDTPAGIGLLAHELAHVAQGGETVVRRACTSDGCPANCHNWTLPLPPWIAGIVAHEQIAVDFGLPPGTIPRASKMFAGLPPVSGMPAGFADLWGNAGPAVEIGEIKSIQTGGVQARREAAHYIGRHDEWLARLPVAPLASDDSAYLTRVGGPRSARPLDRSAYTGSGRDLGLFAGDPGKHLWVRADSMGGVVYWCEGPGLTNPAWLLAFRKAWDALKKEFQDLKRQLQAILEGLTVGGTAAARWMAEMLAEAGAWIADHLTTILLVLLAILVVVAIILLWAEIIVVLAAGAAAVAAAASSIASAEVLAGAAAGILVLLGIALPDLAPATRDLAAALAPEAADAGLAADAYDRPPAGGTGPSSAAARHGDPVRRLTTALAPVLGMGSLTGVVAVARRGVDEPALRGAIGGGLNALVAAGDPVAAATLRTRLAGIGRG